VEIAQAGGLAPGWLGQLAIDGVDGFKAGYGGSGGRRLDGGLQHQQDRQEHAGI
jgi:hypothetical protein